MCSNLLFRPKNPGHTLAYLAYYIAPQNNQITILFELVLF